MAVTERVNQMLEERCLSDTLVRGLDETLQGCFQSQVLDMEREGRDEAGL